MEENFNPFSLSGKNYLVTGAASGIGRVTSILMSRLGAGLILTDVNQAGLEETKSFCKDTDLTMTLDLTQTSLIKAAVIDASSRFGKLHGFVHLAGMPYISPLKTISEEKCSKVYLLNTYSVFELAKAFTNKSVYAGEKGSIVLVSSVYGVVGSAANAGYAMSKAALHGITKSLAVELANKGIRINCVAPGFVKTNMMDRTSGMFSNDHAEIVSGMHPLGLGEPDDIANGIIYLLSDAAKWVTGSILNIDGGFTAQ